MKILMCNTFYYLRGGMERCYFDLKSLLETHGHEVIPFSMADDRNQPSAYASYFVSHVDYPSIQSNGSGVGTKIKLVARVLYSQEAKGKIEALIEATQPDIAHIHGLAHEISPSILPVIKQAGIPLIQTLHDYKLLCPNTSFICRGAICERCKEHRYFNVVRYRCKRDSLSASLLAGIEMYFHHFLNIYEGNIDLFITPSHFLQNKLVEFGVRNPVVQVPNFINLPDLKACYEPEDFFVYSGRLVGIKGVETLLAAMGHVNGSRLYVAGMGELEGHLQKYALENGIENVTFLGHLNTGDLMKLVQQALFSVVPSEWYENYPMTILESFACGTPVIGSNIGGIPEMIKDGWNGLLFEPGNVGELASKIGTMLENRQKTIDMGRNARQQVETNNQPHHHYRQILDIYQQLLTD